MQILVIRRPPLPPINRSTHQTRNPTIMIVKTYWHYRDPPSSVFPWLHNQKLKINLPKPQSFPLVQVLALWSQWPRQFVFLHRENSGSLSRHAKLHHQFPRKTVVSLADVDKTRGAYPCRRCNKGVAIKWSYPHTKSTPEITERHPRTWVTRVIHIRPPPEG